MKTTVRIRTRQLGDALRGYAERRLQAALEPFAGRIDHVSVRISDAEGDFGQRFYSSRVEAEVRPSGGPLVQEVSDADLYAAVDRSFEGLARALHRTLALDIEFPATAIPEPGRPELVVHARP